MRKRLAATTSVLAAALALAVPSAMGATEFGDACVANEISSEPITVFGISAPGNPLPMTAPTSGVITKWEVNLVPAPVSFPHTLKVLRPTGPKTVQIVGEASQNIGPGLNTAEVRIPVQAGDRLGIFGSSPEGTVFCELPSEIAVYGGFLGSGGPVGSTATFVEEAGKVRIPSVAVIEPDADGDGFGDETQDKCPQSAAVQVACPVLILDAVAPAAGKGSVSVLVAVSTESPIAVTGTVKLPGGSKKARVSAQAKLKAAPKTVTPGKIATFKLKFSKSLKSALAALPKRKSLKLKVKAQGTSVAGAVSTDSLTVKLKGRR
jgi:hypothetical protein